MDSPTQRARELVRAQERQFRRAVGRCGVAGRWAHCPNCNVRRPVYHLPSTGVVGCSMCGVEFSARRSS